MYIIEAAHNPEVAGSNPAPAIAEGPGNGAFRSLGGYAAAGGREARVRVPSAPLFLAGDRGLHVGRAGG